MLSGLVEVSNGRHGGSPPLDLGEEGSPILAVLWVTGSMWLTVRDLAAWPVMNSLPWALEPGWTLSEVSLPWALEPGWTLSEV